MTYRGRQRRERDPRNGRLFRIIGSKRVSVTPPKAVRKARLDNLALVPGSVLLEIDRWRAEARKLPRGQLLFVLPKRGVRQRPTYERVADLIRAKGHAVTTLSADHPIDLPVKS